MRSTIRFLLALWLVLTFAAAVGLPVMLDEAYYWTWSRDLGLHYFDHPPGVAWMSRAFGAVLGRSPVAMRVPAILCQVLVVALSILTARQLAPKQPDLATALTVVALVGAPMFTLGYIPMTPDPLQGAAIALMALVLVRALNSPRAVWAFVLPWTFVVGAFIKHTTLIVAAGALVGLLTHADGRRLLRRASFLSGLATSSLVFVPWFQAEVTGALAYQSGRVLSAGSRGIVAVPLMLGSMMGTLGPATALALVAFAFRNILRGSAATRAMAAGASALLAACLVAAWLGSGEANWPMPALVFALPAVAAAFAGARGRFVALYWSGVVCSGLMMVALAHAAHPFAPVPVARDRTLRAAGYADLTEAAIQIADANRARLAIVDGYQVASELRYHSRDSLRVHELAGGRPNQYDVWARPPLCSGERAIIVWPYRAKLPRIAYVELDDPLVLTREKAGRIIARHVVLAVELTASEEACP